MMSTKLSRLGAMLLSAALASGLALSTPAVAAPAGDTEPPPVVQTEMRYVQADSPEEAEKLLDQLEAEQQNDPPTEARRGYLSPRSEQVQR